MLTLTLLTLAGLAQDLQPGPWRAWLDSPGGELPFQLVLGRDEETGGLTGTLVNGPEGIAVTSVGFEAGELTVEIEHYDSRIEARLTEAGRLDGRWTKRSGPATWAELPFHATAGAAPRFRSTEGEPAAGRLGGRWAVDFSSSRDGAVAIFEEGPGHTVTGTFLTTTGDYRFLEGTFAGSTLQLSCFDGAHAFLFRAELDADGKLEGDFWSRDSWHEAWTAVKDGGAQLPDAFTQTVWDERVSLADLVFPDLDGRPRSLADRAFAGRAILVQVFGTWCPNCYDETEYLVELHRRYADRGLSIVGLAFELTGDFQRDARQVRAYQERHGIPYPILVAGTSDKGAATEALAALDRVRSYPTTIFLSGDGAVKAVHTGFSGPATGPAYDHLRTEFEGRIEELLAAEPAGNAALWSWLTQHNWARWRDAGPPTPLAFVEEDGGRWMRLGNGRQPVQVVGDAVWIGDELWRADREAQVLLDPRDVGRRIGGPRTPRARFPPRPAVSPGGPGRGGSGTSPRGDLVPGGRPPHGSRGRAPGAVAAAGRPRPGGAADRHLGPGRAGGPGRGGPAPGPTRLPQRGPATGVGPGPGAHPGHAGSASAGGPRGPRDRSRPPGARRRADGVDIPLTGSPAPGPNLDGWSRAGARAACASGASWSWGWPRPPRSWGLRSWSRRTPRCSGRRP